MSSQIDEVGRLTRAAIRKRDLSDPEAAQKIMRDAHAVSDAALILRQYLFDGETSNVSPDLWIHQIAGAIADAAAAEMDARNDAEFDRQADMTGNEGCPGHPAGEFDRMGETVFCDGSCQEVTR